METEGTQVTNDDTKNEYVVFVATETLTSPVSTSLATPDSTLPQGSPAPSSVQQSQEDIGNHIVSASVQNGSSSSEYVLQNSSISASAPFTGRRFSAVNINKKFLEKNSTASSSVSGHPLSGFGNNKTGSTSIGFSQATMRPGIQNNISHSRLVTTKLTPSLTTTSPAQGWSRPSSATPSPVNHPLQANSMFGSNLNQNHSQLSQGGKTGQLQSHASFKAKGESTDASARPVWRSLTGSTLRASTDSQHDFPTAAEAAKASFMKPNEIRFSSDFTSAQKRAMLETAATFRGAHLDPNAHHWDDMEEDDNDFLENVIEFGDGTQYKVHIENDIPFQISTVDAFTEGLKSNDERLSDVPVSKEERLPDDFDRSWPRTKAIITSSSDETEKGRGSVNGSLTPSNPQTHLNDITHARVLFNERSNRMEPYGSNDSSWQSSPANQGRGLQNNVQVLQKTDRSRSNGVREDDHVSEHIHDVHESRRHATIKEPFEGSAMANSSEDFDSTQLPSSSSSNLGKAKVASRFSLQISNVSPLVSVTTSQKTLVNTDNPDSPLLPDSATSDPPRSFSSLSSRTVMTSSISGRSTTQSPQNGPDSTDVERLRKEYLHISAERAKQRRQQEEEERQKAQERARKKAAELEVRMSAVSPLVDPHDKESQSKVVIIASRSNEQELEQPGLPGINEETISSTFSGALETDDSESSRTLRHEQPKLLRSRLPYNTTTRNAPTGNTMLPSHHALPDGLKDDDSWRKGKGPWLAGVDSNKTVKSEPCPPLPVANSEFSCLDVHPGEDVQVLDFSDIGKLVPMDDNVFILPIDTGRRFKPLRPVASDFFRENDFGPRGQAVKSDDLEERKRNGSINTDLDASPEFVTDVPENGQYENMNEALDRRRFSQTNELTPVFETTPISPGISSHVHPSLKSPRTTSMYREAPMAALTDTMSRIKGALDGMQTANISEGSLDVADSLESKEQQINKSSRGGIWLPPALRSIHPSQYRESFTTHPEPLFSPSPYLHDVIVRFPQRSKKFISVPKKQLTPWRPGTYNNLIICSWDTVVDGRICHYVSFNDILFGKAEYVKGGKLKCRVVLPKNSLTLRGTTVDQLPIEIRQPKVNIPTSNNVGAFGRPKMKHDFSWRAPQAMQSKALVTEQEAGFGAQLQLDITSRSPPPEPLSLSVTLSLDSKPENQARGKTKTNQRSTTADVAFYRDTRTPSDSAPGSLRSVKFTVLSELDVDDKDPFVQSNATKNKEAATEQEDSTKDERSRAADGVTESMNQAENPATLSISSGHSSTNISPVGPMSVVPSTKSDSKTTEESIDAKRMHTMKPSLPTWGQSPLAFHVEGSTTDPPNSELLKAVWSQTSDKERLPTVNSLKGIADDLSSVPFTLHEVKSDDGGTPPPVIQEPVSTQPSRMSASEVARAFQVVPGGSSEGSSSTSLAVPFSPPPSNNRTLPRPGSNIINSSTGTVLRPPYGGYTSPMISHSPSPTLLYAQQHGLNPIPTVPSPQYVQPVWVPLSGSVPQPSVHVMPSHNSPQYNPSYYTYTPALGQTVYSTMQHTTARYYPSNVHSRVPLVNPSQAAMAVHTQSQSPYATNSPVAATTSNQTFSPSNIGRGFMPSRTSYETHSPISPTVQPRQPISNAFQTQSSAPRPTW